MRLIFITLVTLAIATIVGLGATWTTATRGVNVGTITIGAWTARPKTGTSDIDPYSRASVARSGELPVGTGDGVMFTATAPDSARYVVERLVKAMNARVQWIADDQRARYHAGIVHGANHLTTLVAQAIDVLREAGVADPAATLGPLLTATLDNTLRSGHHALTGPIARGDVDTVAAHLTALRVLRDRKAR